MKSPARTAAEYGPRAVGRPGGVIRSIINYSVFLRVGARRVLGRASVELPEAATRLRGRGAFFTGFSSTGGVGATIDGCPATIGCFSSYSLYSGSTSLIGAAGG